MAQFDANTNAPVLPGVQRRYSGTQAGILESNVIDIKDMQAFTFVMQYDLRTFQASNSFTVTNARITESDTGAPASFTSSVTNITGDLNNFNINAGALGSFRYFARAGAFGTKRYVRLELDVTYTENLASPGPVVFCHVQYAPLVAPISE